MFAPCTACRRHVRVSEPRCPFCGGAVGEARYTPRGRGPRAAILFASVVGVAGCGSDYDDSSVVAAYGVPADSSAIVDTGSQPDTAPAVDSTVTDTATPDTATPDTASEDAKGDTPADASADAPADTNDTGAPVPPYGAPFDSGV